MIFGKTKLEMKVGVFVFCGLLILAAFVLSIGKFRSWNAKYKVKFVFHFVNGVRVGAPVRFAGVDVGEVKDIKFGFLPKEQDAQIYVICWVKKDIKIPVDSTIWVNTLGLLGEKYVEIMPGKDYDHCLVPGQSMAGIDPVPMHEIFRMAKGLVDSINDGKGTVGRFLHDDTVYKNIEDFTADIKKHPWKLFFKGKE